MQIDRQRTHAESYRDFLEFVRLDIQRERVLVHRKMFNVFFWCFLLPAIISASILVLIKVHVLPSKARGSLDWMVLIFPVIYSLYILGSEVLSRVPGMFRQGGVSGTLGQALKEAEWRERVRVDMARKVRLKGEEWNWVTESYRIDLNTLQYRVRYLTALAGAVFFLIMQGIDSLGGGGSGTEASVSWTRNPVTGWVESSSYDFSQFVGLTLFLVLLYLSGNQTYHSLMRYLHCIQLNGVDPSKTYESKE